MQVDPNYVSKLSQAISASSANQQKLTAQLASGLRVQTLSDDPVAISSNVQLASTLSNLDSFVHSASGTQGRLQVTDTTLGEVVTQVISAISLTTQAANGTLNAANTAAIATQVGAIRDSVFALANTSYLGNYIFAGSQGQTTPFTLNTSTSPASTTYTGDSVVSSIVTPGGQKLSLNVPGAAVFSGLLATLNQVVSDLQSGSSTAIAGASSALSTSLGTVTLERATIGSALSQLTSASSYAQTEQAQLQAQQSALLSADLPGVATSLQTAELQHQALISVVSALSQTNLFSYLK